jgi:hypothetical protein
MPATQRVLPAALATAAAVGLQVLLPRLFSVVLWYHLGFFAVSLAMFGFAAAGALVARRGAPDPARTSALAGLSLVAALVLVLRLPVDPTRLLESWTAPALLLVAGLLLAVPFLLLGVVVCSALADARGRPGRVYGATFAGGAAGALLCLAAMEWLGAPRAAALLALLPVAGAVLAGWGAAASAASSMRLLFAAGALAVAALAVPDRLLPLVSRKHFPAVPPELVIEQRWNAFSHVTFYDNPDRHGLWALPPDYDGPLPRTIGAAIDTWAITPILERRPGRDAHPVLERYPPSLFYVGAAPGFTALVIGSGGGIDVQAALAAGASHVTAVEINPLIVDAVRGRFAEFCGGLYDDPRVEVVVGEGRDYLERAAAGGLTDAHIGPRKWDRIVLSGVDTFAATEAGAFALSENHLYTVEGVDAALRCLEPDGVLAYTRWWFEPPRQTIRLALTVAQVLRAQGHAHPGPHVYIGLAERNSLMLVHRAGFTEAQLLELQAGAQRRGMLPVYAQNAPSHPLFVAALSLPDTSALIAGYPYRIDPATDDRPFFFEYGRLSGLFRTEGDWIRDRLGGQEILLASLVALLLLCLALVAWLRAGLAAAGTGTRSAGAGLSLRARAGLVLLGAGYLFVEIPVLQRLALVLGHPVLAVAVVLVALLLLSGLGAWLSDRIDSRRLPRIAVTVAVAIVLALVVAHDAWLTSAALAGEGRLWRAAAAIALLAVPGLLLGMPFPLALRQLAHNGPSDALVPAAFLWNGVASVLASPLAILIAMEVGFQATLWVGAGCYAAAAWAFMPDRPSR